MTSRYKNAVRRFLQREDGSVFLIEFVIILPMLFTICLMSIDMSLYSLSQVQLDRGLEQTVRHIRLNTNKSMTYEEIKNMVCENAGKVGDCSNTLRLEMVQVNPRAFATMDQNIDCIDKSLPLEPERGFTLGKRHDLMMLRACLKFDPIFPGSKLGFKFALDGSGQGSMYALSAFVQEPN